jgi:hypothetical protein
MCPKERARKSREKGRNKAKTDRKTDIASIGNHRKTQTIAGRKEVG